MSGLVDQIMSAGGGSAVEMIAGRFGISPAQSKSAIEALTPMIAGGFKNQAQSGGIENIIGGILNQNQVQVGDNPETLAKPGTTAAGNEILGAIFGSKDVSRQVASNAAQATGLNVDMLKQMLPVIATMAAGAMASKASAGGLGSVLGAAMGGNAGGIGGMLGSLLGGSAASNANANSNSGILGSLSNMIDMDKDGNPLDDIMKMLGK